MPVKERPWRMPPKQVLDGGLAWNFHAPRRPLGGVMIAVAAGGALR